MAQFATEFPTKEKPNRAKFLSQVITWLRGSKYSTVLDEHRDTDFDSETVYLRAESGEELRFREFCRSGILEAIGFRHDYPDGEGRLWRTEAVHRNSIDKGSLIRFRTQCIANRAGARLDEPRKPYLIKSLLADGWGGSDGDLEVTQQPIWLKDDDPSLELASLITRGAASLYLPIIYVSTREGSERLLRDNEIEKLAFDLGGVAHVVVEPSRSFSFKLRDSTNGLNVYGGTLGLTSPGQGFARQFYLGWRLADSTAVATSVRSIALTMRSHMPVVGWDWTELQEQALRLQRERERNRLTAAESDQLYQDEIAVLQDRIRELESQVAYRPATAVSDDDDLWISNALMARIGPEIYPGEIMDRLRSAAASACRSADREGLDKRSRALLSRFVNVVPRSTAYAELVEDLKRASKDPKRVAAELQSLLCRHGYYEKSDNKHIRLEALEDYCGLDVITLPKTPSDHRGLTNLRKQIEKILGLTKLD